RGAPAGARPRQSRAPSGAAPFGQAPYHAGYPDPFVATWGMSKGLATTLAAAAVLAFLAVWLIAGSMNASRDATPAQVAGPGQLETRTAQDTAGTATPAPDDDPNTAVSRHSVDDAASGAGLSIPPTSADGRVHLQSGGSISPEEYRDAQRRVQESPVLHSTNAPPPVP
ncbi:MAG TPA: hypothetical protein VKT77_19460, partial [Chthonomonadaceae bacterium]|nr:hypothetical protein [Chthonomonadaceae bacterium]